MADMCRISRACSCTGDSKGEIFIFSVFDGQDVSTFTGLRFEEPEETADCLNRKSCRRRLGDGVETADLGITLFRELDGEVLQEATGVVLLSSEQI